MRQDKVHPLDATRCYKLNGILYVPHYDIVGQYVQPGFVNSTPLMNPESSLRERDAKRITLTVSEVELVAKGAVSTTEFLWRRPEKKEWV